MELQPLRKGETGGEEGDCVKKAESRVPVRSGIPGCSSRCRGNDSMDGTWHDPRVRMIALLVGNPSRWSVVDCSSALFRRMP